MNDSSKKGAMTVGKHQIKHVQIPSRGRGVLHLKLSCTGTSVNQIYQINCSELPQQSPIWWSSTLPPPPRYLLRMDGWLYCIYSLIMSKGAWHQETWGGSKELKRHIQLWKAVSDALFGNVVTDAVPLEQWDSACAVIITPYTHRLAWGSSLAQANMKVLFSLWVWKHNLLHQRYSAYTFIAALMNGEFLHYFWWNYRQNVDLCSCDIYAAWKLPQPLLLRLQALCRRSNTGLAHDMQSAHTGHAQTTTEHNLCVHTVINWGLILWFYCLPGLDVMHHLPLFPAAVKTLSILQHFHTLPVYFLLSIFIILYTLHTVPFIWCLSFFLSLCVHPSLFFPSLSFRSHSPNPPTLLLTSHKISPCHLSLSVHG